MEKEAIVERALTRGVFLCHSSDKVSATGLTVNTLFCHTSALLSLASPPPSLSISVLPPFVCPRILFCLRCAFGLCAEFITLFLASLQPKDGLSSPPTAVH